MQNVIILHCGECENIVKEIIQFMSNAISSTENKGAGWSDVVIALLICGTIIILALISRAIISKKKSIDGLEKEKETLDQQLSKEKEKNDDTIATYRSKIIEFIEREMTSFQKIYNTYDKGRQDEKATLEQIKESVADLKKKSYYNSDDLQTKLQDIEKALKKLTEDICGHDKDLSDSIGSIKSIIEGKDTYFKQSPYLIILNEFLQGKNDINEFLNEKN